MGGHSEDGASALSTGGKATGLGHKNAQGFHLDPAGYGTDFGLPSDCCVACLCKAAACYGVTSPVPS